MKAKPIPKVATTIRLELPILEKMNEAVRKGKCVSNNDFITEAIIEKLNQNVWYICKDIFWNNMGNSYGIFHNGIYSNL